MNRSANLSEQIYCVDLAKNKFQVHAFSPGGECLQRLTLSRGKFDAFFKNAAHAGAWVVMEACASGHYWSRCFQARGYRTKLVPAQFVARQRIGNKTDGNDADAIFAVHRDPRVRPVPVKSPEQQDLCALHRVRELLVRQRTQYINQARGLLAERGCVAARGEGGMAHLLAQIARSTSADITPPLAELIQLLAAQIHALNAQIGGLETRLQDALAHSAVAQRVDSIFGVGTLTATAFAAEYDANLARFADARQFAASLGVTPSEDSSGERRRLGAITRRGNPYLRKLLVQCAQVILMHAATRQDALCVFARRLMERHKRRHTVIVALANRLARIIYAVIKHDTDYHPHGRAQPV